MFSVLSPNPRFFYERATGSPPIRALTRHTCPGITSHLATVRRAGGATPKRGARFESSEALAEQPAVARSAVELHRCCATGCRALRRSSVNILTAWPGRVAQAPRAGRARAPWSCSPCWCPSREPHAVGGPLATARSELAKRRPLYGGQLSSPPYSGRRFSNRSSVSAPHHSWDVGAGPRTRITRISVLCANGPRIIK